MLTPRKPRSPPLNALRAFESAARLGGFKAAANELSVTPGAVAQHIKTLESWAGAALFERMSQGVRLTPLGETVAEDFADAFDRLGQAVIRLRADANPRQIRIAVLPSIAQLWLSQRLPLARARAGSTTISITALDSPPNLYREPFDISIFFHQKKVEDHGIKVCDDSIFPVCAPALAEGLRRPADLAGMTFLHDTRWARDWELWLSTVAPDLRIDSRGPGFSLYSLALQEVQNGAGVIMGHEPLVRASLENGSLVAPFEQTVKLSQCLMITTPHAVRKNSLIEQIITTLCA
ncbi:MAG: LysR substrate-binding domain-containing protein [Gammaproteobacteria bacterium]|nr:LysR substrate-binding domain-containing protein [Gammaproteobacteria bacterium]